MKENNKSKYAPLAKKVIISALIGLAISGAIYYFIRDFIPIVIFFVLFVVIFNAYFILKEKMVEANKVKKMESVFPDFIELVASNLNAGMTIDRALLTSSRKEFSPLDIQINLLGKDILTGKDITSALQEMGRRIKSDKIIKTIELIISGIRSGGNLSILLGEIAGNMRERDFVEKKAASNVLMYVIFIFIAVAIGSPVLFGLSTTVVKVLTDIIAGLPSTEAVSNLPFTISKVSISIDFITYFSLVFIVVINFLASLVLGLVNKGSEKSGIVYTIPMLIISLSIYLAIRIFMISSLSGVFGRF